ncbi:MAG: hypothetical protein WBD40_23020 [Tepidisphaeraceae bacterium]
MTDSYRDNTLIVRLSRLGSHDDLAFESVADAVFLDFKIVFRLQIQPESLGRPEMPREPQARVGGHGAPRLHDLVHTARSNAQILREAILRNPERAQEFLEEDLTGMNRRKFLGRHRYLLLSAQWQSTISTSNASPPFHWKQIRHWSLIRMLYCPARSPESFSRRFAGGTRRSATNSAASSMSSFRNAAFWTATENRREPCRAKICSAWTSAKLRIIPHNDSALRYAIKNLR